MSRLLIYFSLLSLPGAEELGFLGLTIAYILLLVATPLLQVASRPSLLRATLVEQPATLAYLLVLVLFLLLNFTVARMHGVDPMVWVSRSIHLAMIPLYFIVFRFASMNPYRGLRDVVNIGLLEVGLVFVAFFVYLDSEVLRRAADIGGVIVYSVFLLLAAHAALRRFEKEKSRLWLLIYLLTLLAAVLTGTRVLIVSVLFLLAGLDRWVKLVPLALLLALPLPFLVDVGLLDRFDLSQDENVVTVTSKVDELRALWGFFSESPLVGVGFGVPYQVPLANSEYTYTHNILMFYLGYSGLIGAAIALYPILRMFLLPDFRVLAAAMLIFYTSSTTYTNVKHSLLMALILLIVDSQRGSLGDQRTRVW